MPLGFEPLAIVAENIKRAESSERVRKQTISQTYSSAQFDMPEALKHIQL